MVNESQAKSFCEAYTLAAPNQRFVLGTGDYAQSIAGCISIQAFVDDFTSKSRIGDIPIVRTAQLPKDSLVIVASMLRTKTASIGLTKQGLRNLDYYAFERWSGLKVRPISSWTTFRQEFHKYSHELEAVRSRLVDDESRDLFDGLIEFRLTGDIDQLGHAKFNLDGQYFEPFLELERRGESFIDVGCFDGATSIEFARRVESFQQIVAFEPSPENFAKAEENLRNITNGDVKLLPCGLGSRPEQVSFADGEGSSSRVSEAGDEAIQLVSLDSLNLRSATFIKMDIEGGEIPALIGAQQTIERLRPRLAVSVYHLADDLWRIPKTVEGFGVEYDLRLRHYTEGMDETVMFFLPKSGR